MTQHYTDTVGILDFDLNPIITPIIAALFGPFNLKPGYGDTYTVSQCSESDDASWGTFVVNLSERLGLTLSDDFDCEADMRAIGAHLGLDLEWLVTSVAFEADNIRLHDLFRIAREANDGHNLVGLEIQTAHHANKPVADAFGGYGHFAGKRFSYSVDTQHESAKAAEVDLALEDSAQVAAALIRNEVKERLDGIHDSTMRADVTALVLAAEPVTISEEDQKRFTRKDWRYEVSVGESIVGYEAWIVHQLEDEKNALAKKGQ